MLGIVGLLIFLYLLLRTFVQAEPPSAERRRRAEEIVRAWGDDTLDYFALRRDKNYFFSADGRSLIAYLYVRGTAMVAADPIGPPGTRRGRSTSSSTSAPSAAGGSPSSPSARPTPSSTASAACTRSTSATRRSSTATIQPRGPGMKAVRTAVKHVGKDHSFELIAETEAAPELIAELNEISAEWREGSPERGFTMELGEEVEGTQPRLRARDRATRRAAGSPASCASSPSTASEPGYSLDLMRRRPDSANGLTEYLIAEAALALGARGFKRLSLNFAAWGRLLDSAEDAGLSGRAAADGERASTPSSRSRACATSTRSSARSGSRARS